MSRKSSTRRWVRSSAVVSIDEVRLLPDADQRNVLAATLERVNRASNAARAAGLQRNAVQGPRCATS